MASARVTDQAAELCTTMVGSAFLLLLGRAPSPPRVVEEMSRMKPLALLRRIAASGEFHKATIARIAAGDPLSHSARAPEPPAQLVTWLIEVPRPADETILALRAARRWEDLIATLFLDPVCGPALLRADRLEETQALLRARPALDAPGHGDTAASTPQEAIQQAKEIFARLPTAEFLAAWSQLEEQLLFERARLLFQAKQWPELVTMLDSAQDAQASRREMVKRVGRAHIYVKDFARAARLLTRLAEDAPRDAEVHFYAAVAMARQGRLAEASALMRTAIRLKPDSAQYLAESADIQRRLAGEQANNPPARQALLEESNQAWMAALQRDPSLATRAHTRIARNGALVDLLMLRSQALLGLNRVSEALQTAEEVCAREPAHQGARFQLRTLRSLAEGDGDARAFSLTLLAQAPAAGDVECLRLDVAGDTMQWAEVRRHGRAGLKLQPFLEGDAGEWIAFLPALPSPAQLEMWDAALRRARHAAPSWCGRAILDLPATGTVELWRRDLLQALLESGVLDGFQSLAATLRAHADVVATWNAAAPASWSFAKAATRAGRARAGLVVAMSRHGIVKFGGGEQFLDSMAEHYGAMGHRVVIAGTRPEMLGSSGTEAGRDFVFVDESPAALRRYFLEARPVLVHVLSGLGMQVAAALEYLNIPFVYGVHYWRDCLGLGEDSQGFFANLDREPIPKPTFRYVVQRAAVVYSNSAFTQDVLEEAFQLRTPILYSLPRTVEPAEDAAREREAQDLFGDLADFVLLVNAKGDKGFDLLVETARRCPEIPFVAIASQSELREAEAAVAGLHNFTILPRTDRIELLYQRARVVAVPSYRFIETFSRVCIEAQRFGKPVLGSDRGNVPYLLRRSGVILPEQPEAWAEELHRIYGERDYAADLAARARRNSQDYAYDGQARALARVVGAASSRILIGIGSGIGNMPHAGPMIRNIARRLGSPVDIVVAEDHDRSLFLLHNPEYVNATFALRQQVLRKSYDLVFLTHCFGEARVRFEARSVVNSRDWMRFEPGGPHHETIFNLEAAKALLGVPYAPEDTLGYFVGDIRYTPPQGGRRMGFHGGSKDGFWTSKRWPGYAELAKALQARGFEVASFGIAPEYVEGTLDLTGGSIAEMIEKMLSCSYFVSNDSGLMNIANALGIPVTGLFGPTNPATRGPLRASSSWLALEKDCAPCEITPAGRPIFHAGECRCIAELPLPRVLEHVLSEMARHWPAAGIGGGPGRFNAVHGAISSPGGRRDRGPRWPCGYYALAPTPTEMSATWRRPRPWPRWCLPPARMPRSSPSPPPRAAVPIRRATTPPARSRRPSTMTTSIASMCCWWAAAGCSPRRIARSTMPNGSQG
jgi:glycosyltransferase involved in cell wall biosynthesis/tetratricopeptide (TPR) repeat protein